MSNEKAVIYGVKSDENFKYIGKTIKSVRDNRELRKTDVGVQYVNERVKNVLHTSPDVHMVVLKTIALQDWYDEKLLEVVDKHKDNHPLVNAQWMLEGKRGYWEGKERDPHTLQRLSESKYKRVVQYDLEGNRIKIWSSGKEVATKIFKDYVVKSGAGYTKLYSVMNAPRLKGRTRYGSLWFREAELILNFGLIPKRINVDVIRKKELQEKQEKQKNYHRAEVRRRYTIIYCDINGTEIHKYRNIFEAGFALKLNPSIIGRICRGVIVPKNYILKYGEKELQPMDIQKYKYKTQPINKKRKIESNLDVINYDDIWDVDL